MLWILQFNIVVWVKDFQLLVDWLMQCFDKVEEFVKGIVLLEEEEFKEIFCDCVFIWLFEIVEDVKDYYILGMVVFVQFIEFDEQVVFFICLQLSFNKNFKLFIENLDENINVGF